VWLLSYPKKDDIALKTFSRPCKDMHMGGFPTLSILVFSLVFAGVSSAYIYENLAMISCKKKKPA
jgi:hypothetical protein